MTRGALIFAFNNEKIDYVRMAEWSAGNIRRHLGIPTCLVTDRMPEHTNFEKIIIASPHTPGHRHFDDLTETVSWFNGNRVDAYEASPWDQTLVLDADYVVASDRLKELFDCNQDFLAHRWAYDVTGLQTFNDLNYFGRFNMPMWWATVMMFNRSTSTKLIFDSMKMIRANWNHYRNIYQNTRSVYRNDHALTIALGIVNGHTLDHADIPWQLASITPGPGLEYIDTDCYQVNFVTRQKQNRWIRLKNQDFHAMGKGHLGDLIDKIS